ncbi:MAG: prepilin peptidase [Pseudomonadota bacterium]|nr:prepilin peptidase [Pseudomonadota bacterium]
MSLYQFLADPVVLVWVCATLGLLVGSFLNVVIARLPVMLERAWSAECAEWQGQEAAVVEVFNLVHPRSRCPHCTAPIQAWQNVPVLSWLLLRGRCASCGAGISVRYPFIEVLSAVLAAGVASTWGATPQTACGLLLVWGLLALAFIDLDTQYLPDDLTLPLLWLGLLAASLGFGFTSLDQAVWGAMAGYLILWVVCRVFLLITGREGMGGGDFKLLAALGAWFGWQALPMLILISSLVGAACGILAIVLAGHDRRMPIPFGPFLVLAGLTGLFYPAGLRLASWLA